MRFSWAEMVVWQTAAQPESVAGFPPEHVKLFGPFLNVTVPVGVPPLPLTVAVSVMVLLAPEVKAVLGLGVSVVVVGVEAAVSVGDTSRSPISREPTSGVASVSLKAVVYP